MRHYKSMIFLSYQMHLFIWHGRGSQNHTIQDLPTCEYMNKPKVFRSNTHNKAYAKIYLNKQSWQMQLIWHGNTTHGI